MLYGQVDGTPLSQLVGGRGDRVATHCVLLWDVKVNPVSCDHPFFISTFFLALMHLPHFYMYPVADLGFSTGGFWYSIVREKIATTPNFDRFWRETSCSTCHPDLATEAVSFVLQPGRRVPFSLSSVLV